MQSFGSHPAQGQADQQADDVNLIWQICLASLSSNNNELVLPQHLAASLLDSSIDELKRRLSKHLNDTPTMSFVDSQAHTLRICAVPEDPKQKEALAARGSFSQTYNFPNAFVSAYETVKNEVHGKKSKVPRPPNAFILYRQKYHPILKEAQPDLHNNDISVILGKKWQSESESVKAEYKAKAEEIKEQHAIENPGYQYAPRKPSEKKRRMTARKVAQFSPGDAEDDTPDNSPADTNDLTDHDGSDPDRSEHRQISAAEVLKVVRSGSSHLVRDDDGWISMTVPPNNPQLGKEFAEHNSPEDLQPFSDSNRGELVSETLEQVRNDQDFCNSLIDWEGIQEDMDIVMGCCTEAVEEVATTEVGVPYTVLSEEVRNTYFFAEIDRILKLFK